MELVTQISVFLANKPGTLAEVCDELARAKINIYALTVSDTVDHAVVRMVVDQTRKALEIFEERGVLAVENQVLMLDSSNKPGGLAALARHLAANEINIEYAYLSTSPNAAVGLLVMRVSDTPKALKVLQGAA